MLAACERGAKEGLAVYLYGSTPEILAQLEENLHRRFPDLSFAGMESSRSQKSEDLQLERSREAINNKVVSKASRKY